MITGDITERMFRALMVQLIRAGKLDRADIHAAADELEAHGDDDAGNSLRCFHLHAEAPSMVEWHASKRAKQAKDRAAYEAEKARRNDGKPKA